MTTKFIEMSVRPSSDKDGGSVLKIRRTISWDEILMAVAEKYGIVKGTIKLDPVMYVGAEGEAVLSSISAVWDEEIKENG